MKTILSTISLAACLLCTLAATAQNEPLPYGGRQPDSIVTLKTILPGADRPKEVTVAVVDGWAYFEGDIVLGRIEELAAEANERGIVIDGGSFRWPSAVIPFELDPSLFTAAYVRLIQSAIDYITGSTHLLLVPATSGDRIRFIAANACSSPVGRQGGAQNIRLMDPNTNGGTGCWFPQIVHEIAHSAGLFHEQSREDRDLFVTINWGNIESGKAFNFDKEDAVATDIGPYDFNSVMHYGPTAFADPPGAITIVAIGGQAFGNADEYSTGDVATINWMYPTNNCPASFMLSAEIPDVDRPLIFEASTTVTSTATIRASTNATYDGGTLVRLSPGFHAENGSTLHAVKEGCGGSFTQMVSPEVAGWMKEADEKLAERQNASKPDTRTAQSLAATVFPNPTSGSATIRFTLEKEGTATVRIVDALGRLRATVAENRAFPAGETILEIDTDGWENGLYTAQVVSGRAVAAVRLVVFTR